MEELKRLIKKKQYDTIVEHIATIATEVSHCNLLAFLKKEEVFVDRDGKNGFNQYIHNLRVKCPFFAEYCNELDLVNQLFEQERKMQNILKAVPKSKRLPVLLYCINTNYLRALKEFKPLNSQKEVAQDLYIILDGVALLHNVTFKSILYDGEIWKDNSFCYNAFIYSFSLSEYKKCYQYMQLSSITHAWDVIYKAWKENFVKIFRQDDKIVTRYLITPQLEWLNLSKAKLQIYDYIKDLNNALAQKEKLESVSAELEASKELIAWETIKAYLHISDLDTLVDDIPIRFWIKAYCALIEYSKKVNFINYIYSINWLRTFLSRWLLLKNQKEWISLFIKNGIPSEYAAKIFECLKYNQKASDLYDFPLVKVRNKYMIIPALLHIAHPGELLKSRFRQNDFNISEKGKSFEHELHNLVAKHNIPAIQIRRKYNEQEYECDLVFVLRDTLFLCECKDNGNKYIFNYISEFYKKDLQQAKRIFEFYEEHINEIKVEFSNQNFRIEDIKHVEKLLIYNTVFHSIIEESGIKIIDAERFVSFFRRDNLDQRICRLYKGPTDCLLGKITQAKFIKYMQSSYTICEYDKIIRLKNQNFRFGDLNLDIQVEQSNSINREEIMSIINPFKVEFKAFLDDYKKRYKT